VQGISINMPEPTAADAIDQFLKNIGQIGLLVFIFVAAGSVVEEKTRRSLEILLTKPVSRSSFIISKFISLFITIIISYALAAGIFYFYTASLFSAPDPGRFAVMAGDLLVYILMIMALTLWGSTVSKNAVMAAGIGFVFFILFGSLLGLLPALAPYAPGYIFGHYKELMVTGWSSAFLAPLLASVLVIVVSLLASILAFSKQEVER
jgi:ABC-2 type transport system permease protein